MKRSLRVTLILVFSGGWAATQSSAPSGAHRKTQLGWRPWSDSVLPASSVLLADLEVGSEPLHLTVVVHKDDPAAKSLFLSAILYPSSYKRVEWWDVREGRLPNPDAQYPELKQAAAFICDSRTCSPPIFDATRLAARVDKLLNLSREEQRFTLGCWP
jgi:hypothetical protein